jgi:hypothetical protein
MRARIDTNPTHGATLPDEDLMGSGDETLYEVKVDTQGGSFIIKEELACQPVGSLWARNLGEYDTVESNRFIRYFDSLSGDSAVILARDSIKIE